VVVVGVLVDGKLIFTPVEGETRLCRAIGDAPHGGTNECMSALIGTGAGVTKGNIQQVTACAGHPYADDTCANLGYSYGHAARIGQHVEVGFPPIRGKTKRKHTEFHSNPSKKLAEVEVRRSILF
jgi:hypothetical protein